MSLPKHIKEAIDHYLPSMEGWTTPERGCEMAEAIYEVGHDVAVSIGVFSGRSVVAMGFAYRDLHRGMIYGCDPWKVAAAVEGDDSDPKYKEWWAEKSNLEEMHKHTMTVIWLHGLDPWATIIRAASQDVHQLFTEIGVLEIDGNHSEVASCRDVELYLPKVVSGGKIFFDDSSWSTTQKAVQMLSDQCDLIKEGYDNTSYRIYRKR